MPTQYIRIKRTIGSGIHENAIVSRDELLWFGMPAEEIAGQRLADCFGPAENPDPDQHEHATAVGLLESQYFTSYEAAKTKPSEVASLFVTSLNKWRALETQILPPVGIDLVHRATSASTIQVEGIRRDRLRAELAAASSQIDRTYPDLLQAAAKINADIEAVTAFMHSKNLTNVKNAAFDTARNCAASLPAKLKYAEDEEAKKKGWPGVRAQIREKFWGSTVEKITTWSLLGLGALAFFIFQKIWLHYFHQPF